VAALQRPALRRAFLLGAGKGDFILNQYVNDLLKEYNLRLIKLLSGNQVKNEGSRVDSY
jgi:hypothetical protein